MRDSCPSEKVFVAWEHFWNFRYPGLDLHLLYM